MTMRVLTEAEKAELYNGQPSVVRNNANLLSTMIEDLIHLVRSFEELYDHKNPRHRNRDHIALIWRTIGKELSIPEEEAKKKWSNLRSNYMREKRKIAGFPYGSAKVTWPYYNLLQFLDETLEHKRAFEGTPGNKNSALQSDYLATEYESQHLDIWQEHVVAEPKNDTPEEEEFDVRNFAKKRKAAEDFEDMYIQHLDKVTSNIHSEYNDPDFLFLRGLLPMIKSLGPMENLEFKGEVIQLLKKKKLQQQSQSEASVSQTSQPESSETLRIWYADSQTGVFESTSKIPPNDGSIAN